MFDIPTSKTKNVGAFKRANRARCFGFFRFSRIKPERNTRSSSTKSPRKRPECFKRKESPRNRVDQLVAQLEMRSEFCLCINEFDYKIKAIRKILNIYIIKFKKYIAERSKNIQ